MVLVSWWEVYGVYIYGITFIFIFSIGYVIFLFRKHQVLEIYIAVTAHDVPLSDSFTVRKKNSFMIANEYFEGRSVAAKGLNCKIAAKIKYLGKRKFSIEAMEAKIIKEESECEKIIVGIDSYFELKDSEGKCLRLISITTPGQKNNIFEESYGENFI